MNDVGRACRELRENLHKTQQQVADEAGIDIKTVNRFENGKSFYFFAYDWYVKHGLYSKEEGKQ